MKAVRIKLTEEQQAALAPLLEELKAAEGLGSTIGQLDLTFCNDGFPSAWFTVMEPTRTKRVLEAMKRQEGEKGEGKVQWVYDETEADMEVYAW